jgi:hypothetical protein
VPGTYVFSERVLGTALLIAPDAHASTLQTVTCPSRQPLCSVFPNRNVANHEDVCLCPDSDKTPVHLTYQGEHEDRHS